MLENMLFHLFNESELKLRPRQATTAAKDGAARRYPELTGLASALVVVMVVVELLAPTKDMSMAIAIKRKDCMALESWDRPTSAGSLQKCLKQKATSNQQ